MGDVWTAIKAFFHDPIGFVNSPGESVVAYEVEQQKASGMTDKQISEDLESKGLIEGSPLVDTVNAIGKGFGWIAKNLPLIILLVGLFIIAFYVLPLFRRREAA